MQLVLGAHPDAVVHDHLVVEERRPTLLGRIQADVRADRAPPGLPLPEAGDERALLDPEDRNLQVHACHGRARQVEVVRDAILCLLADDPTLEPRDIVVMCPDIEVFAPLIHATGIRHRRGGYRDPESQAFIESWFGKLKEREVWLNEYETLDDARAGVGGYVDRYHHRPHSGLDYLPPREVRQTWEDLQRLAA